MARIVHDMASPGRPEAYPWDTWFDGNTWWLKGGEDFDTTPSNFRHTVYMAAKRRNVSVTCAVDGDNVLIRRTAA